MDEIEKLKSEIALLKTKKRMADRYNKMYEKKIDKIQELLQEALKIKEENPHSFGL